MGTHADYIYDDLKYSLADMSESDRKELFGLITKEYNIETGEATVLCMVMENSEPLPTSPIDNIRALFHLPYRYL